jgi:hypothetical protein
MQGRFEEIFQPKKGLENLFESSCLNCGKFSEKFFRLWKIEITNNKYPIIPVMP